jgi:hypothetical protein
LLPQAVRYGLIACLHRIDNSARKEVIVGLLKQAPVRWPSVVKGMV